MGQSQRGSVLITASVLATALFGIAALAVDGAFLTEVRSELQNAADAAVIAAVSGLVVGQAEGRQRAQQYAGLNPVLRQTVNIAQQDLVFGHWDPDTRQFFQTTTAPNSARVALRLTETSSPAAPGLFFAPVLGQRRADVAATATASLGNRSIVLTLDRSGSMNDDGASPEQPLTDTKAAAKNFLDLLRNFPIEGDQAGLVFYNDVAALEQPLTEDFNQVKAAIDRPNASGFTNIAAALCTARRELLSARAEPRGLKVAVLLSDGRANTRRDPSSCQTVGTPGQDRLIERDANNPSARQALEEGREMARNGVILYTISLGNDTNQASMRNMAEATGGQHFFAPTTDDLEEVFNQIAARIPVGLVE